MTARVVVLGLDAAESRLIEQWGATGDLPVLAELSRSGRTVRLDDNPMNTFPEAIWHELYTGLHAHQIGRYFMLRQVRSGEATSRAFDASELDPSQYFWTIASAAGRRVAVVDPVHCTIAPDFNGTQLLDYGLHDRHFGAISDPPRLLEEIRARHGNYPVESCDTHRATPAGYRSLHERLLAGIALKERVVCDVLGSEHWDLFCATFSESHCAGHQFWHFHDPGHPMYDAAAASEFGPTIKNVYRRLDQMIGRVIDEAGDAVVMVVASHGMGPYVGGYQLLPEVLLRLGMSAGPPAIRGTPRTAVRNAYHHMRNRLGIFRGRRPLVKSGFGRQLRNFFGVPVDGLEDPGTRAVAVPNNRIGAIRLNLRGREPHGCVAPGEEEAALLKELRHELAQLRHPDSGEPIVTSAATPGELFGTSYHPDLPDLLVLFRTDLGPIEACRSESVGLVERSLFKPDHPRTGDHTPHSRMWLRGPGLSAGIDQGSSRDLAPTVLQALGVEIPPTMKPPSTSLRAALDSLETTPRAG